MVSLFSNVIMRFVILIRKKKKKAFWDESYISPIFLYLSSFICLEVIVPLHKENKFIYLFIFSNYPVHRMGKRLVICKVFRDSKKRVECKGDMVQPDGLRRPRKKAFNGYIFTIR